MKHMDKNKIIMDFLSKIINNKKTVLDYLSKIMKKNKKNMIIDRKIISF